MVNNSKHMRQGLKLAISSALFLAATSASAVTVDGNLIDLTNAISASSFNYAIGSDPLGSADSPTTESNNGFDIQTVYSYYDIALDTLFLGMSVYGTVGDSQAVTNTSSLYERTTNLPNANRSVFDSNETYRINLYDGTTTSAPLLLSYSALGQDGGGDIATGVNNPYSLIVTHAVSESFDGVEFSVTGLAAYLGPWGFSNPADLLIFFGAGSTDSNSVSGGAEDTHLLQMQVVPVPAAAWLFGSGLVGLIGFSKRQRKT